MAPALVHWSLRVGGAEITGLGEAARASASPCLAPVASGGPGDEGDLSGRREGSSCSESCGRALVSEGGSAATLGLVSEANGCTSLCGGTSSHLSSLGSFHWWADVSAEVQTLRTSWQIKAQATTEYHGRRPRQQDQTLAVQTRNRYQSSAHFCGAIGCLEKKTIDMYKNIRIYTFIQVVPMKRISANPLLLLNRSASKVNLFNGNELYILRWPN